MMTVAIGSNHTVQIGHLTKMGSLNDILVIGNSYRRAKGQREITLDEWLRRESTWEYIHEVELDRLNELGNPNLCDMDLDLTKKNGIVEYSS